MFITVPTDSLTLAEPSERAPRDLLDRFAKVPAANIGDVLVINGQGDLGDLIGEIRVNKGVLGGVIDGAVRDAETLTAKRLVVFARAARPRRAAQERSRPDRAPVAVSGVVVNPGDVIVADGVVRVPRDRAAWAADQVDQVIE